MDQKLYQSLKALSRIRDLRLRNAQSHEQACQEELARAQAAQEKREGAVQSLSHNQSELTSFLSGQETNQAARMMGMIDARRDFLREELVAERRWLKIERDAVRIAHSKLAEARGDVQEERRRQEGVQRMVSDAKKALIHQEEQVADLDAEEAASSRRPSIGR